MKKLFLILTLICPIMYAQDKELSPWIQQCKELNPVATAGYAHVTAQELYDTLWQFCNMQEKCLKNTLWLNKPAAAQKYFTPFTQKLVVPPQSTICIWGDLHGDIRALVQCLHKLTQEGILDGTFKITQENTYFLFLGDYTDRGMYGAEVLYTLMRLKIANPDRVFMVRGNHEDIALNQQGYGFMFELTQKFGNAAYPILQKCAQLYNLLPVALYLGCADNYVQCCHGGLEVGYNPAALLHSTPNNCCEYITQLLQKTNCAKLPGIKLDQTITDLFQDIPTQELQPFRIGFMWNDFGEQNCYTPSRGFCFGKDFTEQVLQRNPEIKGVIRAHQHNPTMPGLLNPKNGGIYSLWDNLVITMVSAAFFTGTIAFNMLTTAEKFSDWELSSCRRNLTKQTKTDSWKTPTARLKSWKNKKN